MDLEYIAKYRVERRLGTGTFASVYLCYDSDLDSRCAIKLLSEQWSEDENARRWFLNEARVMFEMNHHRIARVYTTGTLDDGRPYFVMEYASGGSLARRMLDLRRGGERYSTAAALKVSLAIAEGLEVAHRRGVVHRDLKPSNVLFARYPDAIGKWLQLPSNEQIKIADFGISRRLEDGTRSLAGIGTPFYMAPEQALARGEDKPDPRSDIYAAAAILYELLAGRAPFPYPTLGQVVSAHLNEEPPPVTTLVRDVPDEVAVLIHFGLQKAPGVRVSSASEWGTLLERAIANLPSAEFSRLIAPIHEPELDESPSADDISPDDSEDESHDEAQETISITGTFSRATAVMPRAEDALLEVEPTDQSPAYAGKDTSRSRRVFDPSHPNQDGPASPFTPLTFASLGILIALVLGLIVLGSTLLGSNGDQSEPGASDLADSVIESLDEPEDAEPSADDASSDDDAAEVVVPTETAVVTPEITATPPEPTPTPIAVPESVLAEIESALATLPGQASAAVVMPDGQSALVEADQQVPAGSLIKLWIAAATLNDANQGRFSITDEHTIQSEDQAPGTGILNGSSYLGETLTFLEIIEIMLLYSDNSAANILTAQVGGMERVNQYASRNGYSETIMQRPLGRLDPTNENYTSAGDVALFFDRVRTNTLINEAVSVFLADVLERRREHDSPSINFFGRDLPDETRYAHISGILPATRNEAGLLHAPDLQQPVVVVMLVDQTGDTGAGEAAISLAVRDIYDALFWQTADDG